MSLVTMERKCFCLMPIFLCVAVLFYRFISFNREWLDNGGERKVLHEKWNNLLLLDNLGQVVLNKSIQHLWEQPLKKWDHMREILAFIHIVKSGGTSFESTISLSKTEDDCRLRCVDKHAGQLTSSRDRICPSLLPVLCGHFDWSTIDDLEQVGNQVAPIVLLRDPIKRVVSHFFYAQRRKEMRNNTMTNQTFGEFLQDLDSMMESRQVWFDGQASASWLAGTNTGPFVADVPEEEALQKDRLRLNWTYMVNTAINNLHKCLWFGILEDLERSMELFKFQTGLNATTHKMNMSIRKEYNITKAELEKLRALMPMDIYLHEYAKQLHEYRCQKYKQNRNNVPNYTPELPQTITGCKSTKYFLDCPELSIHFTFNKMASTAWFAGVHPAPYIPKDPSEPETTRRKNLLSNWTYMLNKAIDNLHKCMWFGLVDDLEKSYEMLRYQTGLNVTLQHINTNKERYKKPNEMEMEKLKVLLPMDMYLYEYAKQLHEYRYKMFKEQQQKQWQQRWKSEPVLLRMPWVLDGCKYHDSLHNCSLLKELFPSFTRKS